MATEQSLDCCQIVKMVSRPSLTICSSWDPYETKLRDGRFPEGYLPFSKEVSSKENSETDTSLTKENGYGHHVTEINYLFPF
ncbi:neuronal regeneration-related protein-like isoform X2 [Spea bombifrons]|nr:neuronal regeneration-related protein-like isoform X2 [Spea bombifrons]XP_053330296.1 neuronal regeneration-related protein-like isoform X2 [Spea bombifrons]